MARVNSIRSKSSELPHRSRGAVGTAYLRTATAIPTHTHTHTLGLGGNKLIRYSRAFKNSNVVLSPYTTTVNILLHIVPAANPLTTANNTDISAHT